MHRNFSFTAGSRSTDIKVGPPRIPWVWLALCDCLRRGLSDFRMVADGAGRPDESESRMGASLDVRISQVERVDGGWTVSATLMDGGHCPACDAKSTRQHGWHVRHLQDLPAQGAGAGCVDRNDRKKVVGAKDPLRRILGGKHPERRKPTKSTRLVLAPATGYDQLAKDRESIGRGAMVGESLRLSAFRPHRGCPWV